MSSVQLRKVSKVFANGARAVSEVDLTVGEGELLALVGASGSGKTTILRLLAGLEQPTGGSIHFGDDDVTSWPAWRRGTAMVAESGSLLPHKTVAENLTWSRERRASGAKKHDTKHVTTQTQTNTENSTLQERNGANGEGMSDTPADEFPNWVERLGLGELLERLPETLSAGQQQRVALGRAMLATPHLMLLDEPLGRLEGPRRTELARQLKQFQRRAAATWIYVTHDRREAASVADRIALLDEGRILQIGTPRELGDDPNSLRVAQWMAARPLTVIRGRWRGDSRGMFDCPWGSWTWPGSRKRAEQDQTEQEKTEQKSTETKRVDQERPVTAVWRANEGRVERREAGRTPGVSDGTPRAWWPGVVRDWEDADGASWVWIEHERGAGELCVEVSAADANWRRGDEVWAGFELARTRWFDAENGQRLREDDLR